MPPAGATCNNGGPGITKGGHDGLSRLTATDISIDGRRDRSDLFTPQSNLSGDCCYNEEDHGVQILDQQLPIDPEWAD